MDGIVLISQANYDRLVDNVIEDAQPALHMSCDWLGHVPKIEIYPLIVYGQIERLRNANSSSRVE